MRKNKLQQSKEDQFSILRERAEDVLNRAIYHRAPEERETLDSIFQELQILQIELEMQNDELRLANEQLELERLKFAGIYDLAPVGYFVLNREGHINEANAAGAQMLDAVKTNLLGKRLIHFVAPDHRGQFYDFYTGLVHKFHKKTGQFKFISHRGREFYVQVEGLAINSTLQCYVAVMDITENIETRLRLAEIRDRLQLAMDASSAGTWELHLPSMQFNFDEGIHRICAVEAGKFNNTYTSFIGLVHAEDQSMVDQHFRTAINTGTEVNIECRFCNISGQVCFANIRGRFVDMPAPTSQRIVGIILDVTEQRSIEQKAEALRQEHQKEITVAALLAEEKERKRISDALHDSVSQLLYGVKLQLNEPDAVNAITKAHKLLDIAIKETRDISFELSPSILTDFGLQSAIEELCQRFSTQHVHITATFSAFNVHTNHFLEETIFRIVQELVNNSMKHSGASKIQISLKKHKSIEIIVADNGCGFSPEKSGTKKSGAGLSSIKNRLSLYNGKLNIDSAPGKGTTVKVHLVV